MSEIRICLHKEQWPLKTPFKITGHEWTDLYAIVVEVTDGDYIGRGEAAGVFYQGESVDSMCEQIRAVWKELESCPGREALREILPAGGARNAIDCALWDLEVARSGNSIWMLAGVPRGPVSTVVTIPILDTPEQMGNEAQKLSAIPSLKVKLSNDEPVKRLEAIRRARPDATIIVDANQGFSFELLQDIMGDLSRLGIVMVEQPLPRGEDECLEGFDSPIPLCADESCLDLEELELVAARYQMINIKLDKCGGLTEGLELAKAAKAKGLDLMVGNMLGTSLAMAPALVVARLCRFVDLDGPLHLQCDRPEGISFDNGQISLPHGTLWGGIAG